MDFNIKINSVEQNNSFEKEEADWHAHLRVKHATEEPAEHPANEKKWPEQYLSEEDIKRLIYQAIFVVLVQDHQTTLEKKADLLKILQTDMAKYNLRDLAAYIDRTIDALWADKKLSRDSFDVLQAFKKIKDKVLIRATLNPSDLDKELAELEELIHGHKIDILHDLA